MAAAFGAAHKAACSAGSGPRYAKTGQDRAGRKRRALLRHDPGSAGETRRPRQKISSRWLGEALACGPGNGGLHALSRRASSRPGLHAGASNGIPAFAEVHVPNVGMGEAHKIFTARAASSTTVASEIRACTIIMSLAQRDSTGTSVGENAVLVLKARNR